MVSFSLARKQPRDKVSKNKRRCVRVLRERERERDGSVPSRMLMRRCMKVFCEIEDSKETQKERVSVKGCESERERERERESGKINTSRAGEFPHFVLRKRHLLSLKMRKESSLIS